MCKCNIWITAGIVLEERSRIQLFENKWWWALFCFAACAFVMYVHVHASWKLGDLWIAGVLHRNSGCNVRKGKDLWWYFSWGLSTETCFDRGWQWIFAITRVSQKWVRIQNQQPCYSLQSPWFVSTLGLGFLRLLARKAILVSRVPCGSKKIYLNYWLYFCYLLEKDKYWTQHLSNKGVSL